MVKSFYADCSVVCRVHSVEHFANNHLKPVPTKNTMQTSYTRKANLSWVWKGNTLQSDETRQGNPTPSVFWRALGKQHDTCVPSPWLDGRVTMKSPLPSAFWQALGKQVFFFPFSSLFSSLLFLLFLFSYLTFVYFFSVFYCFIFWFIFFTFSFLSSWVRFAGQAVVASSIVLHKFPHLADTIMCTISKIGLCRGLFLHLGH